MLVQCDDFGRMDARDEILRARCFPLRLDRISAKDISGFKKALTEAGLIQVYETEDGLYLQVIKWDKHQQVRAKHSKFPACDNNGYQMISDVPVIDSPNLSINKDINIIKESKYEVKKGVLLTGKEAESLINQFGEDGANERIERLSLYLLSTGKKYKSHYYTILNWERNPIVKKISKPVTQKDPDHYIKGKYGHMVER